MVQKKKKNSVRLMNNYDLTNQQNNGIILALIQIQITPSNCSACHPAVSLPVCDPLQAASPAAVLPDMTVQVDGS